jgi:hypothetical protein
MLMLIDRHPEIENRIRAENEKFLRTLYATFDIPIWKARRRAKCTRPDGRRGSHPPSPSGQLTAVCPGG